ncbi:preprotein translocase subunit Sec61beta [archaeon]|nr:preprotein translocase subunit Sec61beta [archaeon]
MKFTQSSGPSGPSSAIGIIRFFDADAGGPKISPEFVMIVALVFIFIVVVITIFG